MTGKSEQSSLSLAFEALISSYLLTGRQRQMGQRLELGPITCIHYDYEWEDQRRSADNFFIWGVPPKEVAAIITEYHPTGNNQLFVVMDRAGLANEYLSAGFSALTPGNYLMAHSLDIVPEFPLPAVHSIHLASTAGETMYLNVIDGANLVLMEDVMDPNLQFYYCLQGSQPVALARNGRIGPNLSWISHVYTKPECRGQGLATSLMSRIMSDCQAAGDRFSLLLATEPAHGLYQRLGYQDLAPVLNFRLH
jgi:GNAT superfamily N-acetyltransferase